MRKDYARSRLSKAVKKTDKEFTTEQKLKKENKKLKKQIAQLRKIINRIDLDQYDNLKNTIIKQELEEKEKKSIDRATKDQAQKEEAWKCYNCNMGVLRLIIFENRVGIRYYRCCDNCSKRTKAKTYNDKVDGIK